MQLVSMSGQCLIEGTILGFLWSRNANSARVRLSRAVPH